MEKIKKYLLIIIIIFVAEGIVLFIIAEPKQLSPNNDKIKIVASFSPLAEFAKEVGKDRVEIITLINQEDALHSFDLTPKNRLAIEKADLIIYNGAGLEPWLDKILSDINNKIRIINSSEGLDLLSYSDTNHNRYTDPHFLLDPVLAAQVVDKISNELIIVDPSKANFYQNNSAAYQNRLNILVNKFNQDLANCKQKIIITPHTSLTYLAKKYNFKEVALSRNHEEVFSPHRLREVIDLARENNLKYIFSERTITNDILTIAKEIKGEVLILISDLILTENDLYQGKSYISTMEDNLKSLKIGMECK